MAQLIAGHMPCSTNQSEKAVWRTSLHARTLRTAARVLPSSS